MAAISSMLHKRFARLAFVTCLLVTTAIVYVMLFKHPPPDQVMKMNSAGRSKDFNLRLRAFGNGKSHHDHASTKLRQLTRNQNKIADDGKGANVEEVEEENKQKSVWDMLDDHEEGEDSSDTKSKPVSSMTAAASDTEERVDNGEMKGKAAWEKFIADHHHTVIGIVFDNCDEPTEQLGTVVLMPDAENGGVKSRTFYNFTLHQEIGEGWTFNIEVKYNGQDLYDNWWELCELEDDLDPNDRTFQCPVNTGRLSLLKDRHVPGYIPKGRYQTKAWVKDTNNAVILCGFSDFIL